MAKSKEQPGPLKACMSVVLKANDVVVAEVEDPALWNAVFAAISSGAPSLPNVAAVLGAPPANLAASSNDNLAPQAAEPSSQGATPTAEPISKFARELGVELEVLVGACDPSASEPFLRLDFHHWEQMKKDLPARGPKSLPPIVFAASVLGLWARHASLGPMTLSNAQAVLGTINLRDANASRGIQSAEWLQSRPNGQVVLNPAQVSKAITIAGCFCKQDWSAWKSL